MKKLMTLVLTVVLLSPAAAFAGSATNAALGLGAFAVFNQILGGVGIFGGLAQPVPVYASPAPVVYAPPAPVVYAPPPVVYAPPSRVVYAPPAPVVYAPAPPVVYAPPVVVAPSPVIVAPGPVVVTRPVVVAPRPFPRPYPVYGHYAHPPVVYRHW